MIHVAQRTLWGITMVLVALAGLVAVGMALTRPEAVAEKYLPPGAPDWIVPSFVAADALTYVVLPLVALVGLVRRSWWTASVLWIAFGATAYTFVSMVGGALVAGVPWSAPLSAVPPLGIYLAAALAAQSRSAVRAGGVAR